jgi:hypothetical protein
VKDKFNFKSLHLYSFLIILFTILFTIMFKWCSRFNKRSSPPQNRVVPIKSTGASVRLQPATCVYWFSRTVSGFQKNEFPKPTILIRHFNKLILLHWTSKKIIKFIFLIRTQCLVNIKLVKMSYHIL